MNHCRPGGPDGFVVPVPISAGSVAVLAEVNFGILAYGCGFHGQAHRPEKGSFRVEVDEVFDADHPVRVVFRHDPGRDVAESFVRNIPGQGVCASGAFFYEGAFDSPPVGQHLGVGEG
ncbi:MAG TPA: hypothetical protein PKE06_21840, partial [Flavilitoribacter sp.]|nr:hypothetical protein [Flavilitoribacter sp.]